jgi:hypothetical protein
MEEAKLRLIQYLLSCKLLALFIADASKMIENEIKLIFDNSETSAHFGVWNFELINSLELNSPKLFQPGSKYKHINPSALTEEVVNLADEFFNEIDDEIDLNPDLFNKITELFLMFFNKRELPFREKIRGLNADQIETDPEIKKLRDRLEIGLPFEIIVKKLITENQEYRDMVVILGIILDVCNDLGIAVPITRKKGGIIFRAYRHGEGVNITNNELSLIYQLVKAYLDNSGKQYITALVMQKLIVLFLEFGHKERFIQPIKRLYGINTGVRVTKDFEKKGAVAKYDYLDKNGTEQKGWFTDYLIKRNILKYNAGGMFALDTDIEAAFRGSDAPGRSRTYGALFGHLVYERKEDGNFNQKLMN